MAAYHRTLGVLGAPLHAGGALNGTYRYLHRLSIQKVVGLLVLIVLTIESLYTKPSPGKAAPPYDFFNLYGACLQAPRTQNTTAVQAQVVICPAIYAYAG